MTTVNKLPRSFPYVKHFLSARENHLAAPQIGRRLRDLRHRYGMALGRKFTQDELASALGVSKGTVAKWETDVQPPGMESVRKLAGFYRVEVSAIVADGGAGGDEETPEDAAAPNLPDVSYLLPQARAIYDRAVGSYITRRWPPPIIERAARELVAYIAGANSVRSRGAGRPELTEEEQVWALEDGVEEVEKAYGPNGIVRRY